MSSPVPKKAHIMTERQKKGALATIKQKQRQKIPKNVLTRNLVEFWPCLNEEQSKEFEKLLGSFHESIHLGLESTLRNLKSGKVKYLIIADELSPRWFATHLIVMALNINRNVRIFIVPKLKKVTKRVKKTSAIVCSISLDCEALEELYDRLKIHSELVKNYCQMEETVLKPETRKKKPKILEDGAKVILLKKSQTAPVNFIPMEVDEIEAEESNIKLGSDFIAFSKNQTDDLSSTSVAQVPLYRPVKIKKILGNENRKNKKK